MIAMSLAEIAASLVDRGVPADLVGLDHAAAQDLVIDGPVDTDSRAMGPRGLFVARIGEHADGLTFAPAAAAAGALACLAERPSQALPTVVVADVQSAFGVLARAVADRAVPPAGDLVVAAITGSSGKTSTKDVLAHVLATAGPTVAPVDSLNGEIGVPLTVCRVTPETSFLVVEMGARGIGHLRYLTGIVPPRIGVVLNVGTAHVGEFGSVDAIAAAKAELVEALPAAADGGVAVLNADDPRVAAMAARTPARVVFVGRGPAAEVRADGVELDDAGRARFNLVTPAGTAPVDLALVGEHHVGNALACAAVALECGLEPAAIAAALGSARPASRWRMEVFHRDGLTIVNDAYNANPDSMAAALRALAAMCPSPGGRRIAVLGQMLELGPDAAQLHAGVGRLARELGIDRLVAVGEGAAPMAADRWFATADETYQWLATHLRPGDIVLFKSSRDSGLRWLGDRLAGLEVPA